MEHTLVLVKKAHEGDKVARGAGLYDCPAVSGAGTRDGGSDPDRVYRSDQGDR